MCTECHEFQGIVEEARGPVLTGFGSREWIAGLISDPTHPSYYGDRNDRMPAYGAEETSTGPGSELPHTWRSTTAQPMAKPSMHTSSLLTECNRVGPEPYKRGILQVLDLARMT